MLPWLSCLALVACADLDPGEPDPAAGSETSANTEVGEDAPQTESDDGSGPEWGDPVDCEFHRPSGPSFIALSGSLGSDAVDIACDFASEDDCINWCPEGGIGLHASCSTPEGYALTLSVVPPQEGSYDDPHGTPSYSLDIRKDELSWSGALENATEHRLTIDRVDEAERMITGELTGAWYPLVVQDLQFPAGSVAGDFELQF